MFCVLEGSYTTFPGCCVNSPLWQCVSALSALRQGVWIQYSRLIQEIVLFTRIYWWVGSWWAASLASLWWGWPNVQKKSVGWILIIYNMFWVCQKSITKTLPYFTIQNTGNFILPSEVAYWIVIVFTIYLIEYSSSKVISNNRKAILRSL